MKLAASLVGLALVSWAGLAQADIPPPNVSQCRDKAVNDPCVDDSEAAGTCQTSTCSRLSYDASGGHGLTTTPCLRCAAGAAPAKVQAVDAGTPVSADAGTPTGQVAVPDAGPVAGVKTAQAAPAATKEASTSSNDCSSAAVGPLAFALLPWLLRKRARQS
jgi:hypothetical protein